MEDFKQYKLQMPHIHPSFKNSDVIKEQTTLFLLLFSECSVF